MVNKNKRTSERETNEKTIRPRRMDEGKEYKKDSTTSSRTGRKVRKDRLRRNKQKLDSKISSNARRPGNIRKTNTRSRQKLDSRKRKSTEKAQKTNVKSMLIPRRTGPLKL